MEGLDERIRNLDVSLFKAIPSQTTADDKESLLLLQRTIRRTGDFTFLEIGSHLGGTIQPYYIDPQCRMIYSIDKRPPSQPDERGGIFEYNDNSTKRMLEGLQQFYPFINEKKIKTFDSDAMEVDRNQIAERPEICFIDGEHTNTAVFSDFKFCLEVCHPDAIIGFHDANLIFDGIENIKSYLFNKSVRFQGLVLGGSVYTILLNKAITQFASELEGFTQNETDYFNKARKDLRRARLNNRYYIMNRYYKLCRFFKKCSLFLGISKSS